MGWLADSVRNSEGRINCFQDSIFGYWPVHGDNLLIEYSAEKEVGWEFLELTEDVQFTGRALNLGYRTGWHGGELQTTSASSVADFITQRRRWFRGYIQGIFSRGIGVRYRILEIYILLTGLLSMFALLGIAADMVFNITPFARAWFFSLPAIAIFCFVYFAGCKSNFKDRLAAGLLCWLFMLLEGIGAWESIVNPPRGFDIIKKT